MIDTVRLELPMAHLQHGMSLNGAGTYWAGWDHRTKGVITIYYRNPTSAEKDSGLYFPNLTGYRSRIHNWAPVVQIVFSVPKLVLGNSLDELDEDCFGRVVNTLRERLRIMGFSPNSSDLAGARVMEVHYAKNILLDGGWTVRQVNQRLDRINVQRRFTNGRKEYPNAGSQLSVGNKSHEITFYDKIAETEKDLGREVVGTLSGSEEVLRFEVQLYTRNKMNSVFEKVGLSHDVNFREAFTKERSRAVLLHYWDEFISPDAHLLFSEDVSPMELLGDIMRSFPTKKPHTLLKLFGLLQVVHSSDEGLVHLRGLLENRMAKGSWGRLYRQLREVTSRLEVLSFQDWYIQAIEQLSELRPLRLLSRE